MEHEVRRLPIAEFTVLTATDCRIRLDDLMDSISRNHDAAIGTSWGTSEPVRAQDAMDPGLQGMIVCVHVGEEKHIFTVEEARKVARICAVSNSCNECRFCLAMTALASALVEEANEAVRHVRHVTN